MAKKTTVKARNPEQQEYAYLLYMQGMEQNDICKKVSVSAPTLISWKKSGEWESKRAARTISIDDLVQKTLRVINEMLDKKENFSADAFAKAVNQLKTLKTSSTVDDDINTFMGFQDYLMRERSNHKGITDQLIKSITSLQDNFIQYRLGNGRSSR